MSYFQQFNERLMYLMTHLTDSKCHRKYYIVNAIILSSRYNCLKKGAEKSQVVSLL